MHAPQSPPRRPLPSSTGRRRSRRLAPLMEPIEGRLLLSAAPVAGLDSLLPLVLLSGNYGGSHYGGHEHGGPRGGPLIDPAPWHLSPSADDAGDGTGFDSLLPLFLVSGNYGGSHYGGHEHGGPRGGPRG